MYMYLYYNVVYVTCIQTVEGYLHIKKKKKQYRSVPGKCPLPSKCPCTPIQGATVAASIQTYGILITHAGQTYELCLSAHGCLPGTLWYLTLIEVQSFVHVGLVHVSSL